MMAAVDDCPGISGARRGRLPHLMTWWRGVLAKGHRPRLQIRVAQDAVHQPGRSADAGPVVVPQCRHQPGVVGGKHHVGQVTRPDALPSPGRQAAAWFGPASTST